MNYYIFWGYFLFILSCFLVFIGMFMFLEDYKVLMDWEFYFNNSVSFNMTFMFDWMSLSFMGCVLLISSMVILYSMWYMYDDIMNFRFLLLVLMFIMSMLFMIISLNLFSILLGWDGLGLVSYCLVVYFNNYKSYNAGLMTVLVNRIGDAGMLLCIAWFLNFGGFNFMYYLTSYNDFSYLILYMIILSSFTKSAQIPFSSWLPAAMAAPTPVSALVHSSTLVTAGVYLLIRFSDFIYLHNCELFLMLSCLTMFMAGLGAIFEHDLKSIIAMSTLSQLGFMMSVLFFGFPLLAFMHLLIHAFFKALMFLCAGLIIHTVNDNQDIRFMGDLVLMYPVMSSSFCVSVLSMCGFPFLSGFYSKDYILDYISYSSSVGWHYLIFYVSAGLTIVYNFRLIFYCYNDSSWLNNPMLSYNDSSWLNNPMYMLVGASIFGGSFFYWLMMIFIDYNLLKLGFKLMIYMFIFFMLFLMIFILKYWIKYMMSGLIISFASNMWFMPEFVLFLINKVYYMSYYVYNKLEMGWGEFLVSKGLYFLFYYISCKLDKFYYNKFSMILLNFLTVFVIFIWFG
uniref:NADH-ubiquinone oxidoreductase chain 5 n=1 Tax=Megaris sp. TaxID=2931300 RepID=A0A8T9ZW11_9HEMI|nr:NADH dehydrogenase subunit 5 [Megaris sp.]